MQTRFATNGQSFSWARFACRFENKKRKKKKFSLTAYTEVGSAVREMVVHRALCKMSDEFGPV
jgi:hypothetical protein